MKVFIDFANGSNYKRKSQSFRSAPLVLIRALTAQPAASITGVMNPTSIIKNHVSPLLVLERLLLLKRQDQMLLGCLTLFIQMLLAAQEASDSQ